MADQLPPMGFLFELDIPGISEDGLAAIADACARPGMWPVDFTPAREERRWFGVRKAYPAVLELPERNLRATPLSILHPDARPDADHVPFVRQHHEALARTLTTIAHFAPQGFDFRAAWVGSPIERTVEVPLGELLGLIRSTGPNEFTRYRVPPTPLASPDGA